MSKNTFTSNMAGQSVDYVKLSVDPSSTTYTFEQNGKSVYFKNFIGSIRIRFQTAAESITIKLTESGETPTQLATCKCESGVTHILLPVVVHNGTLTIELIQAIGTPSSIHYDLLGYNL